MADVMITVLDSIAGHVVNRGCANLCKLTQPNEQHNKYDEETEEKVEEEKEIITFMESDVYSAAEEGVINRVILERKDCLQSLLTPQKNTILHIFLTSKTSEYPEPEINMFVEAILGFCPALLMQVNTKEETPLHIAARYGYASIVNQLIKHAKQDHPHDHHNQDHKSRGAEAAKKMLRMASKEGDTALHEAVRFRHLRVVKILITEDGDFEHNANNSGETPLYMAVERGYNDIAKEIIQKCNSPATCGPNGRNVLHAATILKDKDMIGYILKGIGEGMLIEQDQLGWTPLHHAAHMGNFNAVNMFLRTKMGREAAYMRNRDGNTALHLATVSNNREILLKIIEWCPDSSELVNKRGWNILHFAVQDHSFDGAVEDILQSRTSLSRLINEKDAKGNTPLHHIAITLDSDKLNLIHDPRIDKLAFNDGNKNALDLASTSTKFVWGQKRFKGRLERDGLRSHMRISTLIKDRELQDIEEERQVEHLKKFQDANAVVAALIATVTFAAGFTVPGGFVSEKGPLQGTPILGRNSAFKTFMVMDTIAMVLSTASVLAYLFIYTNLKAKQIWYITILSLFFTIGAMLAMVVAFATGTYAMLGYSITFSIVICVLALSFFILFARFLAECIRKEQS